MAVAAAVSGGRIEMFCYAVEKIVGKAFPPADAEISERRACPCTAVIPSREDGEGPRLRRLGHTQGHLACSMTV
jgi:hypothetical protein